MRTLWIATTVCLASTSVLAQSTSKTLITLDTCFKLARVMEANCPGPANDAAQRQECLENARKVQVECLDLAATAASAPVDRPSVAAAAALPDKPAEVAAPAAATGAISSPGAGPSSEAPAPVNPIAGVSADKGESQPVNVQQAKSVAVAPPEKSVPAIPAVAATPTSVPTAPRGTNWTVSEMASPVDYTPVVTATIRARSENRITPASLVVRCRGGRSELGLRMEGLPPASRGGEILVTQQLNDQPAVKSRWTAAADAKTANYKGDAAALVQSFSEDSRLKIVVSDGSGRDSEAAFQFAGWNAIRDKIASACMWTSTVGKSLVRR